MGLQLKETGLQYLGVLSFFRMHTCFIIDNSLPLQQKCISGVPLLDHIKISIEFMIKELTRSGFLQNKDDMLHLYVTSNPKEHLSSYQHDRLHFDYQLKLIQCRALTFPAETLLTALQQIGRYKILTETQTLLGYRQATVYEPALILFFSSRLSERKISKFQKLLCQYPMRSQFKFIHFRLNLPLKVERGQAILDAMKNEYQGSEEYRRMTEFAYQLNKGIICNIFSTHGRNSLQQVLISAITNYIPTLCVNMSAIQFPSNPFPEMLKNSEFSGLSSNWDGEHTKVQLLKIEQQRSRSKIPFSQRIKMIENNFEFSITEFNNPQFFVDFSYRLSGFQNQRLLEQIPFERYQVFTSKSEFLRTNIEGTNSNINKIHYMLHIAKVQKIYFPLWIKHYNQYLLVGFLRFMPLVGSRQIFVSYANFFKLLNVLTFLKNRKNYSDNKKSEMMLKDYLSSVPGYYLYFLKPFFMHNYGIQISDDYKTAQNQIQIQKRIRNIVVVEKRKNEQLAQENARKHHNYTAKCCPIYNDLQSYQQFSKINAKRNNIQKSISQQVFEAYLSKIDEFHKKINLPTYFSLRNTQKLTPMTRELEKNKIDIEEYNTNYIDTNLNKKRKTVPANLAQDTPFPEEQPLVHTVDNIIEVQHNLLATKKQIEMSTEEINYEMEEEQKSKEEKQMQVQVEQTEKKTQKQQSLKTQQFNPEVLQFANSCLSLKNTIKMVINPKNLRNTLFIRNRQILQRFKN